MRATNCLTVLLAAVPGVALAGAFGEGYSSAEPGGPSMIYARAFTIYSVQEACESSPRPAELRISPNPLLLKVGDRIHRSNASERPSELVVEAYGDDGSFLPEVPIIVGTIEVQNVLRSRSDWDYLEAIREGEDELVVGWACATPDGSLVESHVRIGVTSRGAEGAKQSERLLQSAPHNKSLHPPLDPARLALPLQAVRVKCG